MTFSTRNPSLARALTERGYDQPTPVQAAVLEWEDSNRDLLVSAQTGSGKTIAYGLALGSALLADEKPLPVAPNAPLGLIIAPTRELALQVHRELSWLYAYAGVRLVTCVGGMDPRRERRDLDQGAHVVVGTPGRLRDHLERGALNLQNLKAVVLDEADEMLDLGFSEDLTTLLDAAAPERRMLLFSATLPRDIVALAQRYQRDAARISVTAPAGGHADIDYRLVRVVPDEIPHVVVNLLRQVEAPGAFVFCNTRESSRHLQALLSERGFSAVLLSGELSQNERNRALQALREGRARICVATDVAARGIDLPNLGLVIHADLPNDAATLQHRSGRTGRAGRKGLSVLLASPSRRRRAEQLLKTLGLPIVWQAPPSAEEIRKLDQERLLQDPLLMEAAGEDDQASAAMLLEAYPPQAIAAAFARLLREHRPAPEEVRDPGFGPDSRQGAGARRGQLGDAGAIWFKLGIGRKQNADPRWLLPMICRRGKISRSAIGAIKIFERETKFEVAIPVAEQFAANIRIPDPEGVRIERAEAPDAHGMAGHAGETQAHRHGSKPGRMPKPAGKSARSKAQAEEARA
ncbi:DEAD/DEAH box helicase [Beijerinckia indica]|uniref:DEAD/DEAH box helicase domain protein n=1 Tax=Beijerinckia indica subsp. indica (strain ATCC 9039 / DSM 1715 / NCIMB 8712) TaxID=395963 RepID=B2ICM7_BEII9|nr:DEAD/DEAH box helicase [Beijerinckia indica]ACB93916.1 DEAD/DEAH box helicase domain protein [Beijerinckia indica subsp. indica ATCC 9039]